MATVTALTSKKRSGTVESGSWKVPSNISGDVMVSFVLPLAELQDKTNVVDFELQRSDDGTNWETMYSFRWVGGNYTDRQGNILKGPGVKFNTDNFRNKYVRAKAVLNQQMTIGIDIDGDE